MLLQQPRWYRPSPSRSSGLARYPGESVLALTNVGLSLARSAPFDYGIAPLEEGEIRHLVDVRELPSVDFEAPTTTLWPTSPRLTAAQGSPSRSARPPQPRSLELREVTPSSTRCPIRPPGVPRAIRVSSNAKGIANLEVLYRVAPSEELLDLEQTTQRLLQSPINVASVVRERLAPLLASTEPRAAATRADWPLERLEEVLAQAPSSNPPDVRRLLQAMAWTGTPGRRLP